MFSDRIGAGRQLAQAVAALNPTNPVVLALPRGGVPVAAEVAAALRAPLDVVLVRKIGAPFQPELALGAVTDGDNARTFLNDDVIRLCGVQPDYIREETRRQLSIIDDRRRVYLKGRKPIPLSGRTAIVVDDGIATGATTRAALIAVRAQKPSRIILAVPVAPPDAIEALRKEVDDIVCLETPEYFGGVGMHYADFSQTEDAEVVALLDRAAARGNERRAQLPSPQSNSSTSPPE